MATRTETPAETPPQVPNAAALPQGLDGQPQRPAERAGGSAYLWDYPAVRFGAVVLSIALVALVAWLLFLRPDNQSTVATPGGGPVATSQADLAALSSQLGQPIYWAGTRAGTRLEATVSTSQYVYVRYLSGQAPVGDSSPQFLTVATYSARGALTNLRSYANNVHASKVRIPGGGIAVPVPGSPTSVYSARPGQDFQVEVYDPQPGRALGLIKSGAIVPVPGGVSPSQTTVVTPPG